MCMNDFDAIGKREIAKAKVSIKCVSGPKEGTFILRKSEKPPILQETSQPVNGKSLDRSTVRSTESGEKWHKEIKPVKALKTGDQSAQLHSTATTNSIVDQKNDEKSESATTQEPKDSYFSKHREDIVECLREKNRFDRDKLLKDELICRAIWPWQTEGWDEHNKRIDQLTEKISQIAIRSEQQLEARRKESISSIPNPYSSIAQEILDRPASFYKGFKNLCPDATALNTSQSDHSKLLSNSTKFPSYSEDFKNYSVEGDTYYIVDNQNQEMAIKVPNASFTLLSVPDRKVVHPTNRIDPSLRTCLYQAVPFTSSASLNYEAISLQGNNDDNSKRHFIKQKQAAANIKLKRTFGVSYVKERESTQIGVQQIFRKIHPLVIQCSTMIEPFTSSDGASIETNIDKMIDEVFLHRKHGRIAVSVVPAVNETDFRDYLLPDPDHQTDRLKTFLVNSFEDLPLFFTNSCFLAIPIRFAQAGFYPDLSTEATTTIGIHIKKSLNSKNSYMQNIGREYKPNNPMKHIDTKIKQLTQNWKMSCFEDCSRKADSVYQQLKADFDKIWESENGCSESKLGAAIACVVEEASRNRSMEQVDEQTVDWYLSSVMASECLNFNTLSMKFEIYVPESDFKSCSYPNKRFITTFVHRLKKKFDGWLLSWSTIRHQAHFSNNRISSELADQLAFYSDIIQQIRVLDAPLRLDPAKTRLELSKVDLDALRSNEFSLETAPAVSEPPASPVTETLIKQMYSDFGLTATAFNLPLYTVDTRDCFSFDPIVEQSTVRMRGRDVTKKVYYFDPDNVPNNFEYFEKQFPDKRIGVVTYENYFSHEELLEIERLTHQTELEYFRGAFLPHTGQTTISGKKIKRTKFFFGSRYMWSAHQLAEPHSHVAGGIRTDVSPIPGWMVDKVETPLVQDQIIPANFINSIALNIYHDGEEGLGQHYDDAVRFKQVASGHPADLLAAHLLGRASLLRLAAVQLLQRRLQHPHEQRLRHRHGRRLLRSQRRQALHQTRRHGRQVRCLHPQADAPQLRIRRLPLRLLRRAAAPPVHALRRRVQRFFRATQDDGGRPNP